MAEFIDIPKRLVKEQWTVLLRETERKQESLKIIESSNHFTKFSFVHHWTIWSHLYSSICQVPDLILFAPEGNM